jgi:hypothetical protein
MAPYAGFGKTIVARENSMVRTCGTTGEHSRRIAERDRLDERDGQDEVGIQSVHVAPFSHVSRFTRHGLWRWRTCSASC